MVKSVKLKIVSDGTNRGTKVIDEMGNMIERVQSVQWSMKVGEFSRATIEILDVPIETMVMNGKRQIRKRYIRCLGDAIEEETEDFVGSKLKERPDPIIIDSEDEGV